MYLDAILEVAIGLIFSWLVLSIATMQLQEWISGLFGWRAQLLEDSITRMLTDEQNKNLVEDFYNHPVIASLSRDNKKPSYIPSDRFAQSLFDVLFTAPSQVLPKIQAGLRDIKGIGPESFERLTEAGINTIEDLVNISPDELRDILHPGYERIANEEEILEQAKDLLKSDQ
jgi:predicted flap endonuclease-1-like 5' DNA nuclease